ncbi:transcriptional regulator with XRE-family HTH domain [Nocardioides ginsengisegetis]|uniref:Transcriptional regulator with XRE-family HTH domain n=1 Tax=Nocardioides ginsengisegetis TaxID=661491 RepID=A0A7W3PA67_9ACTN|nr:helix-turn-helix transcriptional regulator [Nocardioides ginsengisegetis]MBA8804179.1 transcriptional regulator with XRE-family HTH domain [Nocardioides ginsengisegetis]
MAFQSMIGDHWDVEPMTVIESARRAAGLSQRRLAELARTQQSSVSEYESHRKSPTLEVVERLLEAADHELLVRPRVFFDRIEDRVVGAFWVPDRLWSVPMPQCLARVQVLKYIFDTDDHQVWDLSDPTERIGYFELVLVHGLPEMLLDSVDGVLLIQAWPHMVLPDVVREAWRPVIEAATRSQDRGPRDPGGLSARIADEIGMAWPPPAQSGRRRRR